ncbi:family 43 glycosylhydrolase [Paenibacillus sp. MMS20-IR301]|uniref:family 43 glycosylhydrolase n=1 Tax=Paenibacillus sp. MMS20-IR301 TaxID=2895946 RepID=UPI0028EDFC12|nr:family 43 glycosylhydrolase [Paenibacillus sp. MMS20-IR301]WNS46242.1 family 43 glycosylhydrolase [Paenibacillus sp. MMS20-IR301]
MKFKSEEPQRKVGWGKPERRITCAIAAVLLLILAGGAYLLLQHGSDRADVAYSGHGGTFKNTLAEMDTPDPSVMYKDGYYYMTFTHNGTDIMVMKSRTLDFRQAERKVVWYPPAETAYSANLWAPEIQYIRGSWYIYFAADDGNNENHRMYVLQGDSGDPLGEYTFKGQVADSTDKWAIDGLAMEVDGELYFVWSGWEGDVNAAQNTYIAPMSDPLTISGPRVLLSEPLLDWERAGGPPYINEGQSVLQHEGRTFIVYSGAGSWTPYYSLGLLALKPGGNPLEPVGWTKSEEPLLAMDEAAGVYGPGHNSFTVSPDGSEQWIVYHATSGEADGWNNRKARAQPVSWDDTGLPVFGKPLALSAALAVPAGTGVFRAEEAVRSGNRLEYPALPAAIDSNTPLLVHYVNPGGAAAEAAAAVNGGPPAVLQLPPTGEDEPGYAYLRLPFTAGKNTVSLELPEGSSAAIKAVEISRYEGEAQTLEGEAAAEDNPYASGGAAASLNGSGAALRFGNIQVPHSGTYTVSVSVLNASPGAKLEAAVNGGTRTAVTLEPQERNQPEFIQLELKLRSGGNEIILFDSEGSFGIDYMDIWQTSE